MTIVVVVVAMVIAHPPYRGVTGELQPSPTIGFTHCRHVSGVRATNKTLKRPIFLERAGTPYTREMEEVPRVSAPEKRHSHN